MAINLSPSATDRCPGSSPTHLDPAHEADGACRAPMTAPRDGVDVAPGELATDDRRRERVPSRRRRWSRSNREPRVAVRRDHRRQPPSQSAADKLDLETVAGIRELMRRAAKEGPESDAAKRLADNAALVQDTMERHANAQRTLSNLSQAFFSIDKTIVGNIRV